MLHLDRIANLTSVPKFDIIISKENQQEDVFQLIKCFKPEWEKNSILVEKMEGGVINTMYKCGIKNSNDDGAIVVRIYLQLDSQEVNNAFDRTREIKNFENLKNLGMIPQLLAVFQNGLCYEYLGGEVLTCDSVRTEKMIPYVTKLLAKLHALPEVEWTSAWSMDQQDNPGIKYPPILHNPERMNRFFKLIPNEEAFKNEFQYCKNYYSTVTSPYVFCHNDTKGENFIWNESKRELKLIDLEHSGMNKQAFEIGSHFCVYTDIRDPKPGQYPSREFQLEWIRSYLEYYYEAIGRTSLEVTANDVERLYVESNRMAQAVRFFIGTACLSLVEYGVYDNYEFCMILLTEYFDNKAKVDAMVLPDVIDE